MRNVSMGLVVMLVLVGTACGSSAPEPVPCDSPVSTTEVTLGDFSFTPVCTAAAPGATLTVSDVGALPHTFTVSGTSVNATVAAGESEQVVLTGVTAGTYRVVCTLHPQMVGSLKVG